MFCGKLFGNVLHQLHLNTMKSVVPMISRNFHVLQMNNTADIATSKISNSIVLPNLQFLSPIKLIINQIAGYKVKGHLKRRCKDCMFVVRHQRLHVECKTHPRHKQMAMKKKDYKTWILTHATQSKVRPF